MKLEAFVSDCKEGKMKKCPCCNGVLSIVLHGLVIETYLKQLRADKIPFYNAGCLYYGDDRDAVFYCSECKVKLDENMKVITLITCPCVDDYKIRQEDCCNEIELQRKYTLKDRVFCDACKIIVLNNDEEYRIAARKIGLSEEILEQVVNKKNSNLMLKNHMLYKSYLCDEEEVRRRLEHWKH